MSLGLITLLFAITLLHEDDFVLAVHPAILLVKQDNLEL